MCINTLYTYGIRIVPNNLGLEGQIGQGPSSIHVFSPIPVLCVHSSFRVIMFALQKMIIRHMCYIQFNTMLVHLMLEVASLYYLGLCC